MKTKNSLSSITNYIYAMQNYTLQNPEEFYFDTFKRIQFCTLPEKNYPKNVPIFENIMEQLECLEGIQLDIPVLATYDLLKQKNAKFSAILAIDIFNQ